jgi:hypothetical protein
MIAATKKTESGFIITVIQDDSAVNCRSIQGVKASSGSNPKSFTAESRQRRFSVEIKKDGEYVSTTFTAAPKNNKSMGKKIYFATAESAIAKIEKILDSGNYSMHFGQYYAI